MALTGIAFRRLTTALLGSVGALAGGAALAEDRPVHTVEDVVVVAQHREQILQDVPVAVTALTSSALEQQGMSDIKALNLVTPNLNVQATTKTSLIYLRGVGQNSGSPGQEQTVSIYIDNVYIPAMAANVFQFNNIERLEVLRGPQGTLFGRNSTGGLVHILTRNPSRTFTGDMAVGAASYQTFTGDLYLSGPLTSTLSADLAIQGTTQKDGWGKNLVTGEDVNLGDSFNMRSKLLWEPSDRTRVMTSLGYFRARDDLGTARNVLPCAWTQQNTCVPTQVNLPSLRNLPFTNIYDTQAVPRSRDDNKVLLGSVQVEQDVGFAQLTSITALTYSSAHEINEADGAPAITTFTDWRDVTRAWSQEFRLGSQSDAPFTWIAGYFYFHAIAENSPISTVSGNGTFTATDNNQSTNSHAVFAQATFPLFSDSTNLTLGGRYTTEKRKFTGSRYNQLGAVVTPRFSFGPRTSSSPTFRVALDHRFNEEVMAYASVSTGFKSGLYSPQGFTEVYVRPEKLTSYEAGIKSDLFDRRLRLNLSAFLYDYKDIQNIAYDGTIGVLRNAAESRIKGIEGELQAVVTDALTLRGSIGLLDAKYRSFPGAQENAAINPATGVATTVIIDASGFRMRTAPKVTGSLGFTYVTDLGEAGSLTLAGTGAYNDGFFFDNAMRSRQTSFSEFNASLRWASQDSSLWARLWVNNLTDKAHLLQISSGNGRFDLGTPAAPRTFGLTVGKRF